MLNDIANSYTYNVTAQKENQYKTAKTQSIAPNELNYKDTELYQKVDKFVENGYQSTLGLQISDKYRDELKNDLYTMLSDEPQGGGLRAYMYGLFDHAVNGTKNIFYYMNPQNVGEQKAKEITDFVLGEVFAEVKGFLDIKKDLSDSRDTDIFTQEMSQSELIAKAKNLGATKKAEQANKEDIQNSEQNKADETERNNRMLLRKYNGAKSKNLNTESKNEIPKTFFEEFLKNNNPLAFLEIMKKTDIKA
ncbi:MAG: hypothetical protein SOZ73_00535 [Campylobacter sp.]|nr:hypothetical protein [Campylobacter sp.]